MSSNHCLIRHGSSSTNRHRCRTRCAGRSLMPAAPRRATLSTVKAIPVITAARRSRRSNGSDNSDGNSGHIDHGDHGSHCGPCRGCGGFADAERPCGNTWHCQLPLARRSATADPPVAAGPPDYLPPLAPRSPAVRRRRPPLACRIAGQCLSPVGRRRGSKRRSPLMRQELDDRASQCSHAARAALIQDQHL